MEGKKALSPLVSSVLLLGFAVALGVLIISWGQSVSAQEVKIPGCEKAGLSIIDINGIHQVCYSNEKLLFTIENNGQEDVQAVKVSIIDSEITKLEIEKDLKVGDIARLSADYKNGQAIKKVKLTPRLKGNTYCPNDGVEAEQIRMCE